MHHFVRLLRLAKNAIKCCIQVCRDEKGHQIQPELQSSIMLLVEHNFRHNAVVLRVTLKSRMLIFQHNVCIYPYSKRPSPPPPPLLSFLHAYPVIMPVFYLQTKNEIPIISPHPHISIPIYLVLKWIAWFLCDVVRPSKKTVLAKYIDCFEAYFLVQL